MICDCCMKVFELHNPFERGAEPIPHHANTRSFASSITAGCPICRAILSELDEPQKLLSDLNVVSSTELVVHGNAQFYLLGFTWKLQGIPRHYRCLLLEPYHTIRPYLPHKPLQTHRGWDGQTQQLVKTWIRNCLEQHQECQDLHVWRTSNSNFQPKRLVDVGAAGQTTWRLALREDITIFPSAYATLSHRWQHNQRFRLFSENLQIFTNGQSLDILPQVLQDAVQVIRSLGIRYLWVDCLCIIQDSVPDWEIESLEMCKVYTNSICNISITGFEDNSTGFLDKAGDYVPLPCGVQPNWAADIDGGWFVVDPFFWWAQVTKAPLTKRGWVFQERFLAPRVIHFGPDQLLWECASLDACESFPQGIPAIVESRGHTGFKRMDFLLENDTRETLFQEKDDLLSMAKEDLLYQWCGIVQAYTRTSLTKPSDKLIALAGVAQLISQSGNPTNTQGSKRYLAGLFDQHLLLMLEWHSSNLSLRSEHASARPPHYRAPSWSWASVEGRVFYDYLPRHIDDRKLWGHKPSWELFTERLNQEIGPGRLQVPSKCLDWKPLVFNIKSFVTTAGESPFGKILYGSVELTGVLILAHPILLISRNNPSLRPTLPYLDAPAASESIQPSTLLLPLRCIQLRSQLDEEPFYWVTGLLLEPVGGDAVTYRRCGLLSILSTDGVRGIGIEVTNSPFTAKYSNDRKLETIKLI